MNLNNIAIVCGGLKRAGLEMVICGLSQGMKNQGLDVTVFSMLGGDLEIELQDAGIDVRVLAARKGRYHPNYFHSLIMAMKMAYLLKSKKIQAINIHGLGPEKISVLASNLAATPLKTFVFHSNYPALDPIYGDKKLAKKLKNSLSHMDHCIAISQTVKKWVIDSNVIKKEKISVIVNGVNIANAKAIRSRDEVRKSLGISAEDKVLIQVGRFHPLKNQDISVKALALILRKDPKVHLIFVGDGPKLEDAMDLAKRCHVFQNIHFLGIRSDVRDLLGASDLFLLPSSWEGIPMSLLEAFANSVPAIAADVPGIRDVVILEPSCAKLVQAKDVDSFAMSVVEALKNKYWLQRAKEASFNLVKNNFDSARMVEEYISLHKKLYSKLRDSARR